MILMRSTHTHTDRLNKAHTHTYHTHTHTQCTYQISWATTNNLSDYSMVEIKTTVTCDNLSLGNVKSLVARVDDGSIRVHLSSLPMVAFEFKRAPSNAERAGRIKSGVHVRREESFGRERQESSSRFHLRVLEVPQVGKYMLNLGHIRRDEEERFENSPRVPR